MSIFHAYDANLHDMFNELIVQLVDGIFQNI